MVGSEDEPKAPLRSRAADSPRPALLGRIADELKAHLRSQAADEPKAPLPGRAADAPKAPLPGRAADAPKAPLPGRAADASKAPLPGRAAEEPKTQWRSRAVEEPKTQLHSRPAEEPKTQWRSRAADQPPSQAPRRPSDVFARPGNGSEAKPSAQLSNALTYEADALRRKLNGAARDIVQVMDSELPRDLERRFASGEGEVYTHHLLENRVARLPHIVERRYKAEREVRARIDAYIRLFERLLDTFAEAPKGDQMVDASLASKSGKLYLLLAQASGRISPQ